MLPTQKKPLQNDFTIYDLAALPTEKQAAFIDGITDDEAAWILRDWRANARPKQRAPGGAWTIWLLLAGRGFGKSRTGSEWIIERARAGRGPIALVGETVADVRKIMVEGEGAGSAILECSPPDFRPEYQPSTRSLLWPNGVQATTYSGDRPDQLRGPNTQTVWMDELAKYKYAQMAWDMMEFGLRVGDDPRCLVTTTPRPLKILRDLQADPGCVVVTGSTYENKANLAPAFYQRIMQRYEGTRLGRQEIHAELLEEAEGALWTRDMIDGAGRVDAEDLPQMKRIVVAIDPSGGTGEIGIGAAGLGIDGHGYVLEDATMRGRPESWASVAGALFRKHKADRIVAEKNFGGQMVESTLRAHDRDLPVKLVNASRGKAVRAEPVSSLYEQRRVHHVGLLPKLEDEMVLWDPVESNWSPNRIDWLVWAITELMLEERKPKYSRRRRSAPV